MSECAIGRSRDLWSQPDEQTQDFHGFATGRRRKRGRQARSDIMMRSGWRWLKQTRRNKREGKREKESGEDESGSDVITKSS